jgi:hypothetical protein
MGHSTSQAQKDKGQYVQKPKTVQSIYSKIHSFHVYIIYFITFILVLETNTVSFPALITQVQYFLCGARFNTAPCTLSKCV